MVHVSQPNTTRQGLWIGPHVFHMKFETIEVRVNTNRIYHRRLYTLHFFALQPGRSGLSSSSWGFLLAVCPWMRLQFSSPSASIFNTLKNIAWRAALTLFGRGDLRSRLEIYNCTDWELTIEFLSISAPLTFTDAFYCFSILHLHIPKYFSDIKLPNIKCQEPLQEPLQVPITCNYKPPKYPDIISLPNDSNKRALSGYQR